jgi:hypothetical protein
MSAEESRIEQKLDLLIALLRIAHRGPIVGAREQLRADKTSWAVLREARGDWVEAGNLKKKVSVVSGASNPTIVRRIAELVEIGALERAGAGGHVRYRTTALFDV